MLFLAKRVRRCSLCLNCLFLFSPSIYAWMYVETSLQQFLSIIAYVLLACTRGTECLDVMLDSQILSSCALQVGSFDAGYGSSIMSRLVCYHVIKTNHTSNTDTIWCSCLEKTNRFVCLLFCSSANFIFSCL